MRVLLVQITSLSPKIRREERPDWSLNNFYELRFDVPDALAHATGSRFKFDGCEKSDGQVGRFYADNEKK